MDSVEAYYWITTPDLRPDFRLVTDFLGWRDRNVDSDGNAAHPASHEWTELYHRDRRFPHELYDVTEYSADPLILQIEASSRELAARVAYFLADWCNGAMSSSPQGPFLPPGALVSDMGKFDLEEAMKRVQNSRFRDATRENPYPR